MRLKPKSLDWWNNSFQGKQTESVKGCMFLFLLNKEVNKTWLVCYPTHASSPALYQKSQLKSYHFSQFTEWIQTWVGALEMSRIMHDEQGSLLWVLEQGGWEVLCLSHRKEEVFAQEVDVVTLWLYPEKKKKKGFYRFPTTPFFYSSPILFKFIRK